MATTDRTRHHTASVNGSLSFDSILATVRKLWNAAEAADEAQQAEIKNVDLLDWLRQCRPAGLYEQGKAIYEKGGLNLATLTDEQQIEAEDDYRICARRGSTAEAKPKRQRRKKYEDDE